MPEIACFSSFCRCFGRSGTCVPDDDGMIHVVFYHNTSTGYTPRGREYFLSSSDGLQAPRTTGKYELRSRLDVSIVEMVVYIIPPLNYTGARARFLIKSNILSP